VTRSEVLIGIQTTSTRYEEIRAQVEREYAATPTWVLFPRSAAPSPLCDVHDRHRVFGRCTCSVSPETARTIYGPIDVLTETKRRFRIAMRELETESG